MTELLIELCEFLNDARFLFENLHKFHTKYYKGQITELLSKADDLYVKAKVLLDESKNV